MSLVIEEIWKIQHSKGFEEKPTGCGVPDWPGPSNDGGFCGTIAMNLALGIGVWKGPTENDRLIEALHRELSSTMAELTRKGQGDLIRHILYSISWSPSGLEGDAPELQPLVDSLVEELVTSGRLRSLTEQWLLRERRGW